MEKVKYQHAEGKFTSTDGQVGKSVEILSYNFYIINRHRAIQ